MVSPHRTPGKRHAHQRSVVIAGLSGDSGLGWVRWRSACVGSAGGGSTVARWHGGGTVACRAGGDGVAVAVSGGVRPGVGGCGSGLR